MMLSRQKSSGGAGAIEMKQRMGSKKGEHGLRLHCCVLGQAGELLVQ